MYVHLRMHYRSCESSTHHFARSLDVQSSPPTKPHPFASGISLTLYPCPQCRSCVVLRYIACHFTRDATLTFERRRSTNILLFMSPSERNTRSNISSSPSWYDKFRRSKDSRIACKKLKIKTVFINTCVNKTAAIEEFTSQCKYLIANIIAK